MSLSARQMQSIVDEIGSTIKRNINIMDEEGYIVASTDPSRIGMLHKGAKNIIENNLDMEVISQDRSDQETRPGINYPLVVNGKLVGVVGITGDIEEIGAFGEVIQRMTEMLIMDRYRNNLKRTQENLRKNMGIEWLFGKDGENLRNSAVLLGMNLWIPRRIAVSEIVFPIEKSGEIREEYEEIDRLLRKSIGSDPQQLVMSMGNREILFLKDDQSILQGISKQLTSLEKKYSCSIYTGLGTPGIGKETIIKSYKTAEAASILARKSANGHIMSYDDTDLRFLLSEISKEKKDRYMEKIWGKCADKKERDEMIQCLRVYIKNEGSLSKTADELFIHKNTLQYRLSKIKNITGYDPRKINETLYLNIAVILEELTKEEIE